MDIEPVNYKLGEVPWLVPCHDTVKPLCSQALPCRLLTNWSTQHQNQTACQHLQHSNKSAWLCSSSLPPSGIMQDININSVWWKLHISYHRASDEAVFYWKLHPINHPCPQNDSGIHKSHQKAQENCTHNNAIALSKKQKQN